MAKKKQPDRTDKKTVTRSISLAVQECTSMTWKDFMRVLHGAWAESTMLANWASHELARQDTVRVPGMERLPPMPQIDLYASAFGRDKEKPAKKEGKAPLPVVPASYEGAERWQGAKIAAATLLRKVFRKYAKERGKIVWRRERRSPEFLYPFPFPVHSQAWAVYYIDRGGDHRQLGRDGNGRLQNGEGGRSAIISMQLPGGQVAVRLRQGPDFAHALRVLEKIEAGELKQMELAVCRQRAGGSHRRESEPRPTGNGRHEARPAGTSTSQNGSRGPGGAHRDSWRIILRISYQMEVPTVREDGMLAEVKTGVSPFVQVDVPELSPWLLFAPWVQRWITMHQKFLAQFSDDLKYEKRWPACKRRGLDRHRQRRCDKHARRMKTFLQQTAAQVVGYAARKGCTKLRWDDTDRGFAPSFPWATLRTMIQNKCDELGVGLILACEAPEEGEADRALEVAPAQTEE
jgi:hypothetical protein